ncbi:MAG TPA: immunoglobulin domain-containing protein [Candidatus Acidoferrum sp.]|nr:immunoglobulin domain-containing protein [Candidatus Acidoferrum sp.]
MRNSKIMTRNPITHLSAVCLAASAVVLGSLGAKAATQNVTLDPSRAYNGYENIYTNGLVNTTWPAYKSDYLGAGTSFPNQSSIDTSGNVTIAPSIRPDQLFPTDTLIWADASGSSAAICRDIEDFYAESLSFGAGDTVLFSGILTANTLAAPYKDTAIAFIKDYDSTWAFKGIQSVNLNTLTNGQPFVVTYPAISAAGDHVQWGLEWAGPPSRAATVASLGSATIATNLIAAPPPSKTVNVSVDHNQYWAAYQTVNAGAAYTAGYLGAGGAPDIQGTISASDVVRCAPDVRMDKLFHTDTTIWADATGLSDPNPGVTVDSTYYVDTGSIAVNGDTVIFSGQLLTNTLAGADATSIVAFIKDFDSTWGYHGMQTTYLWPLTNGEVFSVEKVIQGGGSHIQYGFEWVGPPARTNPAAASFVDNMGYVLVTNQLVLTTVGIAAINPSPAQVQLGSNITVTAVATGSGLTFQWSKGGVNLTNGAGISGATNNALTLSNVQGNQEGLYSLVVKDSGGNTASNAVSLFVFNPGWLYFDRAYNPFNGYINVWNGAKLISSRPSSGAAGTSPTASFGFAVAPSSLVRASMNTSDDVITLQPNTYVYDNATNTSDANYINPDGSSAAYLEQDYYMQNNSLVGDTLVFAGYCSSNSLDPKYTATAWIKVSQDWSVENRYDTNLVAGKPFILTVPASATTGKSFVQCGFAIWGPDNSGTNPITQGACEVKVYSPLSATHSGGNPNLGFPTVINHDYTLQYKTNLTDSSWQSYSTNRGTGNTVTVPDATGSKHRFYRLWIQ